jgi:hypothetical protein
VYGLSGRVYLPNMRPSAQNFSTAKKEREKKREKKRKKIRKSNTKKLIDLMKTVVSATWEAEAAGLLETNSCRPALAI